MHRLEVSILRLEADPPLAEEEVLGARGIAIACNGDLRRHRCRRRDGFNVILGPFVAVEAFATPTTNDRPDGSATSVPTVPRLPQGSGQCGG